MTARTIAERVDDRPRTGARRRTRPTFASSLPVCALTLALAGCDGGEASEDTVRVPQLRIGTTDMALSLAATDRIEARRRDVEVLASAALRREVWVRSRVPGSSDCARLGQTGDEPVSGDDKPFAGGFELIVDEPADGSVNPALALLDGLDAPDPVSLLVSWSVPHRTPGEEAEEALVLLDVAEYPLIIAGPGLSTDPGEAVDEGEAGGSSDTSILLTTPPGDPAEAGTIKADAVEGPVPCDALTALTRDPDGDDVDSLDELNAGLRIEDVLEGSTPLADGGRIDVIVVAGGGDRASGDPLSPTWRVYRPMAPNGPLGGDTLELPPLGEGRDPLELRIATASDDSGAMLVEAAFPADYDRSDGELTMEIDGPEGSFDCLGGASPFALPDLQPSDAAPNDTPSEGVYLDASESPSRLTVRCDSKAFTPSGRLTLPLVRVSVSRGESENGGVPVNEVWELRNLELFVHDATTASGPASSR